MRLRTNDPVVSLRADGTAECAECGLPLFPFAREARRVRLECANHHHAEAPVPTDAAALRVIHNWIAKKGAQLHVQHERWGTDDLKGRDEREV